MVMTTRCPHCGTAFKVVPDQLRVRNGLVRCGACNTVFDGRASLVAHLPSAQPPPGGNVATAQPQAAVPPVAPLVHGQSPARPMAASVAVAPDEPVEPSLPPWRADAAGASAAPTTAPPAVPHDAPPPDVAQPYLSAAAAGSTAARPEPRLSAAQAGPPAVLRGRNHMRRHDPYLGGQALHTDPASDDAVSDYDDHDSAQAPAPERAPVSGAGAAAFRPAVPGARGRAYDDDAHPDDDDGPDVEPAVRGEARTRFYGATDVGRTPPEFLDPEHQARRSLLRSLWGYGCVLGALLLALQLVYVYRTAIAVAAPQLRPLLTRVCEPLGCQIGYARRIERIFITSSSLQPPRGQAGATGPNDAHRLVLRVSLRNRYDKPQHWPALRLDLTDLSDTVVMRKVLRPQDYLPAAQAATPFEPGAELNIEVPIEVSGAQVNGYQIDKFFP